MLYVNELDHNTSFKPSSLFMEWNENKFNIEANKPNEIITIEFYINV